MNTAINDSKFCDYNTGIETIISSVLATGMAMNVRYNCLKILFQNRYAISIKL